MDNPRITYVVHIAATPEELWVALTSPDALMKNWGRIESKWSVGSKVSEIDGARKVIWVRGGKGHKGRQVMLSAPLREVLAAYYRWKRPTDWLFPGGRAGQPCADRRSDR